MSDERPIKYDFIPTPGVQTYRYVYRCCNDRSGQGGHPFFEFLWDGRENLADPASCERARLIEQIEARLVTCTRCIRFGGAGSSEYRLVESRPVDTEAEQKSKQAEKIKAQAEQLAEIYKLFTQNSHMRWDVTMPETFAQKESTTGDFHPIAAVFTEPRQTQTAMTVPTIASRPPATSVPAGTILRITDSNEVFVAVQTVGGMVWQTYAPDPKLYYATTTTPLLGHHFPRALTAEEIEKATTGAPMKLSGELKDRLPAAMVPARSTFRVERTGEIFLRAFTDDSQPIWVWIGGPSARQLDTLHDIMDNMHKEEKNMATNPISKETKVQKVITVLKDDGKEAGWRVAGKQFVRMARDPLVAVLCRHLAPKDKSFKAKLVKFLESEAGEAALAAILSMALLSMPDATGEVPKRLSQELRVASMAGTGDLVAEVVMGPLRQLLTSPLMGDLIKAVPAPDALEDGVSGAKVADIREREKVAK